MADFDLTQTDAQVQSILNDGQNMKGAGAQTTLTTESVLLKDVKGKYHKILKSSFTEAIRDTLAGLLVNNDKGTTINQIAAIASGDFGSITPANLASVLGGVVSLGASYSGDINEIKQTSICRVKGSEASGTLPSDYGDWFCLITIVADSLCGIQIATRANAEGAYIRFLWDRSWGNTWYSISLT